MVDPADDVQGPVAVLLPVVGVRLQHQPDALALEDGQQLLHGPPELLLAQRGLAGLPFSSLFMVSTPSSAAMAMARFQ